jgi:predicted nucleic acid-binding protein
MKVFLDTNIVLDILERRQPHFLQSRDVLQCCQDQSFPVFIAWHSLANAFYIYGKKVGTSLAEEALREMLDVITVATVGHAEARRAFTLGFNDLEDGLQAVAAEACGADWIITRNAPDYTCSPIPAIVPADFLLRFPGK